MTQLIRRALQVLGLTALMVVAVSQPETSPSAAAATELLPNIEALPATELRLETVDGRIYLRFTTTTWNSGLGPLELVAGPVDTGSGKQQVLQRVYSSDGSTNTFQAGWFAWHDLHGHFHFDDYAIYSLRPVDRPESVARQSSKTTFCVIDTDRIDHKLPGAPKRSVYNSCGTGIQGMSVGWGDAYRYYLAGQSFDITGLPDGDYILRVGADPLDRIAETDESAADNTSEITLRLFEGTVELLAQGESDSGPGNSNGRGGGRPF